MLAVEDQLVTDAFVKRYNEEDAHFEGLDNSEEGSFVICSFWYVECLARMGQVRKARLLFEKLLNYNTEGGDIVDEEEVAEGQES